MLFDFPKISEQFIKMSHSLTKGGRGGGGVLEETAIDIVL